MYKCRVCTNAITIVFVKCYNLESQVFKQKALFSVLFNNLVSERGGQGCLWCLRQYF